MGLQGNLETFSLPEILQLIAVQQKSGVLRLTAGDDVAVIFFEGGRIVSTRDRRRNAKDPLKPFLVKTGRLTEAQLKQIETIELESRRELTDILLTGNYLTSDDLGRTIEDQIQDTLHQLLTWKTGQYNFSGDARTVPKFAVNVRLNTEGLLMESMRRMDEMARYKQTFSSLAMVLRPKPLAAPPKEMTDAERRVAPLVDGLRPLRDVLGQSKLVEFEALEALHHLLEVGMIEVSLGAVPQLGPSLATPPISKPAPEPGGGVALAVGGFVLAASIAIGIWAVPPLMARLASGSEPAMTARHTAPEISTVNDAARLTIALETYRSAHGRYPAELSTLGREGFLPTDETVRVVARYIYQTDGTTYTRVIR
ncbi:MAG TPA: DUF4388 domain-containing protein [Candidatus Eisenbacteria bacterium]|nr:DUF4388 domain-containing protein [Candidatus Eisenbacteria bacterium]